MGIIATAIMGYKPLKLGSTGKIVVAIQTRLRELGYPLKGTGYFGPATDTAVTDFQRRSGLKPDGNVGPVTATALDNAPAIAVSEKLTPEVKTEIGRPLWLTYGLTLLGTKEVPGNASNKVIIDWARGEGGDISKSYTHDSIPFCALFMNHLFTKAGLKGTETLWALDWAGKWPSNRLAGPAVGAVAPMLRNGGGHVICVVGRDQHGNIMGLGSNQSDTTSVIPFPLSRLNKGFWWPDDVPLPAEVGFDKLPIVKSDGRISSKEA